MQKNNLQDIFLTKVRKQSLPVTVFLMNGFQPLTASPWCWTPTASSR